MEARIMRMLDKEMIRRVDLEDYFATIGSSKSLQVKRMKTFQLKLNKSPIYKSRLLS
jgi:hypothetical protein